MVCKIHSQSSHSTLLVTMFNALQKTEVCIPYLGYAPCNSRGIYFTTSELQGAYSRYGIHTSVFAVCKWWVGRQCLYWLTRWLPSQSRNPLITWQWQISHGSPSPTLTKMMPTGAIHGIQTIYFHTMG